MKNLEKLEEHYKKELALAQKHKQTAEDLKKEIDLLKGTMISQKVKALNFNTDEYGKLIELLNNKKGLMEAIDLVVGNTENVKGDDSLDAEKETVVNDNNNCNTVGNNIRGYVTEKS